MSRHEDDLPVSGFEKRENVSTEQQRTKGDWRMMWVTGLGQIVANIHDPDKCAGDRCAVHNPSNHHMREWPTSLRDSDGSSFGVFTERICEHGIGHPDPDDPFAPSVHGCDGCCKVQP